MLSVPGLPNPLAASLYKIVLSLDAVNPILDQVVREKSQRVKRLHVAGVRGEVRMTGEALTRNGSPAKRMGWDRVQFTLHVRIKETRGNDVVLRVHRLELRNPVARGIDFLRLAGRFSSRVRRQLLQEINEVIPEVIGLTHASDEFIFHTDYFISMVPTLMSTLGTIKLVGVTAADLDRVHFYVQSTLFLVRMVDFFGPQYLSLEHIQRETDSLEMLWG